MLKISSITISIWPQYQEKILNLEAMVFSTAQCHTSEFYQKILNNQRQLSHIATINDQLVGFIFSAPLEIFSATPGVKEDPYFGENSVLYTADMVVNPQSQGQGIGKALKLQQIKDAKQLGYQYIAGRNRLKYADAMWHINKSVGSKEIQRLTGIYQDGREPNACIYHHLVL